jgi:hypothetical protein
MPSPKDIKKLLNVARGEKTAKKAATLDEIMGRLPDIDPALQARISAELDAIEQKRRDAYKVPQTSKKTGKAALADAKRLLASKEPVLKQFNPRAELQRQVLEAELQRLQAGREAFLEPSKAQMRLYHGTTATEGGKGNEAIQRIKPSKEGSLGSGVYMTPNTGRASGYAESPWDGNLNLDRHSPNVLPVYAQIRNPLILEGTHNDPMVEALTKLGMDEDKARSMVDRAYEERGYIGKQVQSRAQAAGYDGIMQYRDGDLSEVVSYNPNAVKSAIGNQGTYDIENPDITKAEGGVAHMAKGGKLLKALRKGEQGVEAGKDLQSMVEATRPLTAAERAYLAEMAAREGEELARLRPAETAPVATKGKSKGPSPKPARAKPKTKAEISEIAERVAPQMIEGQFVRLDPSKSTNPVGKSRKQWDIEQDLEHDMQRSRDVREAEDIDLEKHLNEVMLTLPGDTSISDMDIFGIGGNPLSRPSRQYGGSRFGLDRPDDSVWASGLDQAAAFQRRVNDASQQYGDVPVLANFLAMGPDGLNYATHFADALLKNIDLSKMSADDIDAFNRMMRYGRQGVKAPDFPGIENPEAAYLYLANNPVARKLVFNPLMQLTKTTEGLRLPSGLNVRHAITEPELRDIEPGTTGYSLLQMQPGVERLKPSAHPTYGYDIPGKFLGRTDILYPYEMTFPDTVAEIRANPRQAAQEFGTLQFLGGKQIIDRQLLDEIGEYRRRIKELTGKAEGGVVHMQGGGNPGEVSGDMFKPKPLEMPSIFADAAAKLKAQFEKERRSMRKPGAVQDVLMRGPVAFSMGAPMDIIGMGGEALDYLQTKIPGLRERASVMDTGPERVPTMGYAPKVSLAPEGRYGTEAAQDLLKQAGLTTDEERPLFEMGAGITAPIAGAATLKTGKALAPTARDVLEMQLEKSMKPYQMAVAPEGKAGKVKAPANKVGFYNPAEKAALNLQRKKGPGSAFVSDMQKTPGVNQERLNDLGLGDLASRPDVTRDEILEAAEQNRIPLRETVRRPYEEGSEYSETLDGLKESNRFYEGGIQQMRDEIARVSAMAPDSPMIAQFERKIEAMQEKIAQNKERIAAKQPSLYGPDSHPEYNMPGGENYREIRVGLPDTSKKEFAWEAFDPANPSGQMFATEAEARAAIKNKPGSVLAKVEVSESNPAFYDRNHHGDEPNVLFHLRVADHTDAEGKRGLLIDELQSDWHQKGREKGYKASSARPFSQIDKDIDAVLAELRSKPGVSYAPSADDWAKHPEIMAKADALIAERDLATKTKRSVPNAPFKDNWYQLGLKRAIKEAADTGMDRVYLTTGNRQTLRYSEDQRKGMEHWYDKQYKNFLDKYAKQFGGKVGETKLIVGKQQNDWPAFREWFAAKYPPGSARGGSGTALYQWEEGANNKFVKEFEKSLGDKYETVYYIDIPPKMRESAKIGQSYKDGGSVSQDVAAPQDLTAHLNNLLRQHHGMAEGGAVNLEEKLNNLLRQHHGMAEGGEVEAPYNADPDMSDQGMFVQAPAFAEGGAVKSIRTVN